MARQIREGRQGASEEVAACGRNSFRALEILNPNELRNASYRKGNLLKLTSANGSRWKLRLGSLGLGLLAPGLVFGVAVAVSEDLRLLYVVGAILLFCGATWVGAKSGGNWLSAFLLYVPLAGMFGFAVLRQLPFLWPHLLLWALAIALGLFLLAARLTRIVPKNYVFKGVFFGPNTISCSELHLEGHGLIGRIVTELASRAKLFQSF
jgi:hypothetical protein